MPKITGIYVGQNKVRPKGREPGANCVGYYPLENDFNDYSGNGYNLTNSGLVLGTSGDGYKGAALGAGRYATTSGFNFFNNTLLTKTIAFWTGCNSVITGSWTVAIFLSATGNAAERAKGIGYTTYDYATRGLGNLWTDGIGYTSGAQPIDMINLIDANAMHSYVIATDAPNNQVKLYKDGEFVKAVSLTLGYDSATGFQIGTSGTGAGRYANGYIRQVVYDTSSWTADEVLAYHKGTA